MSPAQGQAATADEHDAHCVWLPARQPHRGARVLGRVPYSTVRLCSGGGAHEAIPEPRQRLDLSVLRRRLEAQGVPVVDARVLLLVRLEREVTISRDGRILIKSRDAAESQRILADFTRRLELPLDPSTSRHRARTPAVP